MRWRRRVGAAHRGHAFPSREDQLNQLGTVLTLLDTVLLGTSIRLLRGDALDTLIVVVLGRGALLGLLALCGKSLRQPPSCTSS